jgi:hypothetical protein
MKKLIELFKLLFTRDNAAAVAAGLVDYSGQGRRREGDSK